VRRGGVASYALASPAAALPLGVSQLIVHGDGDDAVPPALSREYAAAASRAGDPVDTLWIPGDGHEELIDPGAAHWPVLAGWLSAHLAPVLR
jgi:fermentation-respiration switch protein FrsA (DUF1100 family)